MSAPKKFFVYLLASKPNGTLYVGVTSDLPKRIYEHKQGLADGFTKKYGVKELVYYELHDSAESAIRREKQIKEWKRQWKIDLIQSHNRGWLDKFDEIATG